MATRLLAALNLGNIAWDVGANVGYYTLRMADRVGTCGRVIAFEPSPANIERLRANCKGRLNVEIVPLGLSSVAGRFRFAQGSDEIGTTSRVVSTLDRSADAVAEVDLCTGDSLVAEGTLPCPNVLKIDVEGHELEVIKGIPRILRHNGLRTVVIEVHFGLLAKDGHANAPRLIEQTLAQVGFTLSWLDSSHLLAQRSITDG